jgi:DUF4097 and DUF4098 domain-containing protein YvlB
MEETLMMNHTRQPAPTVAWLLAMFAMFAGVTVAAAEPVKTRAFRHTFPEQQGELRLGNLAGRVDLVKAPGKQVIVETTVHAAGESASETQKLLDGMKWVRSKDGKGNPEVILSYPVDDYRGFAYPRSGQNENELPEWLSWLEGAGHTSSMYRDERVRIYGAPRASVPVLYANLKIFLPAGSKVVVRNVVGAVRGGQLEGTLHVKTGSGDIQMASHIGRLTLDTGSGDVTVGAATGETRIDTGSGDVVVRKLVGNGVVDTGSGDVTVENVSACKLAVDTGSGDVVVKNGMVSHVLADTSSGSVQVLGIELEELDAGTGSGDVVVRTSLAKAKRVSAETGSGDVTIYGGAEASFDIESSHGSGELDVRYSDAEIRRSGKKVVGARRGNGRTVIRVETGSGDCVISPREKG